MEPGGAGTTLLAARNLGLDAIALGAIGDDFHGEWLARILSAAGIDISALVIPPDSSTATVVALSEGRRDAHVFLGHYGQGPPITLTAAAARQLTSADAVFIAVYTLVEERLSPLVEGLLDFMANSEAPLVIDAGPFLGQLDDAGLARALAAADVLLLTDAEIRYVTAGATDADACRRLLAQYPELRIVLKRGAAGCRLLARDQDIVCPGFDVPVVDSIGAGDAFAAAWIWADLNGYSPAECGTIGNAMGAASVGRAGAGRNVPSRAQLQRVLDQQNTGVTLTC